MEDWGIHSRPVKFLNFSDLTPLQASKKYHMLVVEKDGKTWAVHQNSRDLVKGFIAVCKGEFGGKHTSAQKIVVESIIGMDRHVVVHTLLGNGKWDVSHTKGEVE